MERDQALRIAARQELNRRLAKPAAEQLFSQLEQWAYDPDDPGKRLNAIKAASGVPSMTTRTLKYLGSYGNVGATMCVVMPRRGPQAVSYLMALEEAARNDQVGVVDSGQADGLT